MDFFSDTLKPRRFDSIFNLRGVYPLKVVSVINYKGGVGKTTISANLAVGLASRGKKVLVIDLDPQASLTFSFFKVDEWRDNFSRFKTIKNWYDAFIDNDADLNIEDLIVKKKYQRFDLDVICSHLALINVDMELAGRLPGMNERDLRSNYLRVHSRLKKGIESLSNKYDYILIDCPPNFNIVTKTAIVASDFLLVPTKPDYLSTLGIEYLEKHVKEMVLTYNDHVLKVNNNSNGDLREIKPRILGIVFTMIQIRNQRPISTLQNYINQIKRTKTPVFETFIRENKTLFGSAPEYGIPVAIMGGVSGVTYEGIQDELESLTDEFISKV
ncbi:MAG: AAA family ATPase [Magnetococcales bacterium]|nr:AAA family ATPase [Magnetococcales bacterium]